MNHLSPLVATEPRGGVNDVDLQSRSPQQHRRQLTQQAGYATPFRRGHPDKQPRAHEAKDNEVALEGGGRGANRATGHCSR